MSEVRSSFELHKLRITIICDSCSVRPYINELDITNLSLKTSKRSKYIEIAKINNYKSRFRTQNRIFY